MKRRLGQAGLTLGAALHQLARMLEMLLVLALLAVCVLGYRLSTGPIQLPELASKLASVASGQGIDIQVQRADLTWAGYHQGGGVPFYLQLGGIVVRNAEGVELGAIQSAQLTFSFAALMNSGTPIVVRSTQARMVGSDVPVSLLAYVWFGRDMELDDADMEVTLGAGQLLVGQGGVPVRAGRFHVHLTPDTVALSGGEMVLAPVGGSAPLVGFSGQAALDGAQWKGRLSATADRVQAADVGAYWPPAAIPLTRLWVTRNVTAGTATDASFSFDLAAPRNLAQLELSEATGSFTAQDVSLIWLPHAQPITALNGRFALLDRNNILITASSARLGGVTLKSGQFLITNMSIRDIPTVGELEVTMGSQITDALAILAAPPLNLLRQAPPQIAQATGNAAMTLTAAIPFLKDIRLEDVTLHVGAALSDVALPSPLAGLGFTAGSAQLDATTHALHVTGTAQFAGQPAALNVAASFVRGGTLEFQMQSLAGPELLHYYGLDTSTAPGGTIGGLAPYTVKISGDYAGTQKLVLAADLTPASFGVPRLGWAKQAGTAGQFGLTAVLSHGGLASLSSFQASAPELEIEGEAQGSRILLPVVDVGRTRGQGFVAPPNGADPGWEIGLSGAALELRAMPKAAPGSTTPAPASPAQPPDLAPPSGPPWRVRLDFQQIYLAASPAPVLGPLLFTGDGVGGTLLHGQGTAGGVTLAVKPVSALRREVDVQATDTGGLLRSLGSYGGMDGGSGSLMAVYGGGVPMEGTLTLQDFRISHAPVFVKIMQAMTIYGVPAAASGPGLAFSQAVVPFSLDGDTLFLHGARAYSSSLGFTATGSVPLGGGNADLDATVVPAYAINAFLGKIPLIGGLFRAEKGGGLIAMRANISGKLSDPNVSLNPLSAITPGFLRGIFGVGEGSGAAK
jgi:hypothetical protein